MSRTAIQTVSRRASASMAILVAACGARQSAPHKPVAPQVETTAAGAAVGTGQLNATHVPPPIPKPGPLSRPKSRRVGVPMQLAQRANPSDNPQSPEKVALGEKLFFDGRLSADGTVACATCHDPARAFTDGRSASIGIKGRVGQRNSPTIMNALYNASQFWDGRATTLEEQAALPIVNPFEMGQPTVDAAVAAIAADADYQRAFRVVFGSAPNGADLVRALASYERTQLAFDTPFDHFIAGDRDALGEDAKRGWQLFNGRAQCNKCHALSSTAPDPTNFVDDDFHNIGVGIIHHDVVALARKANALVASGDTAAVDRTAIQNEMSALGRYLVTKRQADIASFKTPDIRNVLVTAPYFHDGSHQTLWDVVDHYNKGDGLQNPWLDQDIEPLALTENEIDDVVAFMASLTSPEYAALGRTELARQRQQARESRPQRDTKRAFGPKPVQPKPPP
jgi:cytochrome c peroxidase